MRSALAQNGIKRRRQTASVALTHRSLRTHKIKLVNNKNVFALDVDVNVTTLPTSVPKQMTGAGLQHALLKN